ncbi:hypothetical protein IRT45_03370 [Nocardia sp. BSTN01]|uniref:hypothetical protein n=1 Tax=Nocardia sp. BSTN01 TaxID=2783665 RepID=UPI00188E4052|nr:hypothetical protein [Nocardia sp. BSTN01]MBF4996196.1 hypothetical protein [Nocardia sp. BSTN01]
MGGVGGHGPHRSRGRAARHPPAPAFALGDALDLLARTTAALGRAVVLAPGPLLTTRAVDHGFRRAGTRSAGGSTRLLRTADGWCALTLSRADDIAVVPAIIGTHRIDDHWKSLVGTGHGMPVFCADAIGDPLSGIAAALAVCAAVRAGGGVLADVSMRAVTAAFAAAPPRCPGPHRVFTHDGRWQVRCAHTATTQAVLSPRSAQSRAASGFPGGVAC